MSWFATSCQDICKATANKIEPQNDYMLIFKIMSVNAFLTKWVLYHCLRSYYWLNPIWIFITFNRNLYSSPLTLVFWDWVCSPGWPSTWAWDQPASVFRVLGLKVWVTVSYNTFATKRDYLSSTAHCKRWEPTSKSCPLTSTRMLWHVDTHTQEIIF